MPEFKDAPMWKKWFFFCIVIAMTFLLFTFAMGSAFGAPGYGSKGMQARFIIAFLATLTALMLALGIIFSDELNANKIALICFIVFAFVGGKSTQTFRQNVQFLNRMLLGRILMVLFSMDCIDTQAVS